MNYREQTEFKNYLDLRIEREIRGISLDEFSRDSKFSLRQLRDFEAKRFDRLPNKIVLRSLVKLYTQKLGLDPDMVQLEYPIHLNMDDQDRFDIKKRGLKKLVQDVQIGPLIGFFLITFSLMIFLWPLKVEKIFKEPETDMDSDIDVSVSRIDAMHYFETWFRNKVSFYPDRIRSGEVAVVAIRPGDLQVTTKNPTWMRVDDMASGINAMYTLFPGEIQTISIQDETFVRFENPECVTITQLEQDIFSGKRLVEAIQFVPDKIPDIINTDNR